MAIGAAQYRNRNEELRAKNLQIHKVLEFFRPENNRCIVCSLRGMAEWDTHTFDNVCRENVATAKDDNWHLYRTVLKAPPGYCYLCYMPQGGPVRTSSFPLS